MYGYVYKTTNQVNNKVYVGQKKGDFEKSYYGSGLLLKRAINKYGTIHFKIDILQFAGSQEELDNLERLYIAEMKKFFSLYNIASGGVGGGHPQSEKTKRLIGDANTARQFPPQSDYTRQLRSKSVKLSWEKRRPAKLTIECAGCGKTFHVLPCNWERRYCTLTCYRAQKEHII